MSNFSACPIWANMSLLICPMCLLICPMCLLKYPICLLICLICLLICPMCLLICPMCLLICPICLLICPMCLLICPICLLIFSICLQIRPNVLSSNIAQCWNCFFPLVGPNVFRTFKNPYQNHLKDQNITHIWGARAIVPEVPWKPPEPPPVQGVAKTTRGSKLGNQEHRSCFSISVPRLQYFVYLPC